MSARATVSTSVSGSPQSLGHFRLQRLHPKQCFGRHLKRPHPGRRGLAELRLKASLHLLKRPRPAELDRHERHGRLRHRHDRMGYGDVGDVAGAAASTFEPSSRRRLATPAFSATRMFGVTRWLTICSSESVAPCSSPTS